GGAIDDEVSGLRVAGCGSKETGLGVTEVNKSTKIAPDFDPYSRRAEGAYPLSVNFGATPTLDPDGHMTVICFDSTRQTTAIPTVPPVNFFGYTDKFPK
ncbi:MAG: hypothetical protein WCB15_18275, partial [Desulfobacterales bacterium]